MHWSIDILKTQVETAFCLGFIKHKKITLLKSLSYRWRYHCNCGHTWLSSMQKRLRLVWSWSRGSALSTRITRVCANTRQIRPYAWMSLIPIPYQTQFKPIVSPQVSFFISFVQTLSLYVQSFILCCTSHSYYYFQAEKKRMSAAKNARTRVRECSLFFASLVAG